MKKRIWILVVVLLLGLIAIIGNFFLNNNLLENVNTIIDISSLTKNGESLMIYEISDYDSFVEDYNNNQLPDVYVTKFLYDGTGMYKAYDLDDFIEEGNEIIVDVVETTVINITKTGNYELNGELIGGMVAVNTNNLKGNINILLNKTKIDTDSKKIPAIYIYNKDITSTDCKVTINALDGTDNYIEGGKFKKVSLLASDELDNYKDKYTGEISINYDTYSNYYGVYTKEEIERVLFATVTADREDLADGDPYYYYKGSGAISSDIDLYFEGKGTLKVVSKGKEGIETKGNLSFEGGVGDYTVLAYDDCLNTTTDETENKNAHNDLTIDVHSLTAIVNNEASEGDAIDSNGKLVINNGTVIAIAKPGQDAGLDSEKGTIINGGTIIATGDMYDQISSDSTQKYMVLSFGEKVKESSLITLLNEEEKVIFSYLTDREYSTLVFSAKVLEDGNYTLYQDGEIKGESNNGLYLDGTYTKGTQLGYTSKNTMEGGPRGDMGKMPEGERPEMPNGEPPEKPEGEMNDLPERPEMENPPKMGERGEMPNGERPDGNMMPGNFGNMNINAKNKDFSISDIANMFSGVAKLVNE